VLRTEATVTRAPGLAATFSAFTLLYIALTAATIWLLRRIATGSPAGPGTGTGLVASG
jgi:cytochrome bd-type quinol oxidase subunit 1